LKLKNNNDKQIKILFLDFNIHYIAPTRNLVPSMLKNKFDVTMYGPGYTSEKTLKDGLDEFYKKSGPFDFVLASEHIIFYRNNLENNKGKSLLDIYSSNYVVRFQNISLLNFLNNAFEFFKNTRVKKIITMFETDYIYFNHDKSKILEDLDCYMIAEGSQLIRPTKKFKKVKYEKFFDKANDNWAYFAKKNIKKIISVPHFVSESEFFYGDIQNRKKIINVPGVNYYNRKRAIKILKKAKINLDSKFHMILYSLFAKLGFKPFSNPHLLKLYNNIFNESIINSKYSFSCGSANEVTLRKFFEIPALGSLLIMEPFNSEGKQMLVSLGYLEDRNFISCTVDNLVDKINELEKNKEYASEIAYNGQKLILKNHSSIARSEQIFKSLDAISKGQFKGTSWVKGKFKLI
tara:strand:+ start:169 stop:1383 length:1215 start_codon:yes stop_codon:yes gene_type:complete